MLQIVADMGQIGLSGADLPDDFQCGVDVEMRRVRCRPKSIDDEHFDSAQGVDAFLRYVVGVGAVRDIPDAKSQHLVFRAMEQADGCDACPEDFEGGGPIPITSREGVAPGCESGPSLNA